MHMLDYTVNVIHLHSSMHRSTHNAYTWLHDKNYTCVWLCDQSNTFTLLHKNVINLYDYMINLHNFYNVPCMCIRLTMQPCKCTFDYTCKYIYVYGI